MAHPLQMDGAEKERIRDASEIVRVIGEHVSLRAKGREYACLCPFHDDHHPSMMVVPAKQIFHCFVCGAGGDVFSFIQKYHRMEFREALEYLAQRANITLSPRAAAGREDGAPATSRADLVRANSDACGFFRAILRHPEHGAAARAIVEGRGIAPEMVEEFQIGASPQRWDGLLVTARKHGVSPEVLVEAGLLKRREGGDGVYDTFRNRLMFPIHDQIGRVVAFGGRRIDEEEEPKYLNSPETRIFEKSATLFGLHRASRSIQTERIAVVTEGYTDVIACHQAGICNVVATLGTALTARHAGVLRRLCDTVVLLFDGDEAGRRAVDRAVEVFFAEALDVKIATLSGVTDAKDPDELLRRAEGAALLRRAIENAAELMSYRFARVRESVRGAGVGAIGRAVEEELGRLVELGLGGLPPLRQRLVLRHIAAVAGVDEGTIAASIPRGRSASRRERAPSPLAARARTRREELLGCLLVRPDLWSQSPPEDREQLRAERFDPGPSREVAAAAVRRLEAGDAEGLQGFLGGVMAELEGEEPRAAAAALAVHISMITEHDGELVGRHWRDCLRILSLDQEDGAAQGGQTLSARRRRVAALGGDRRLAPRPAALPRRIGGGA